MSFSLLDIAFLKSVTFLGKLPAESGFEAVFANPALQSSQRPGQMLLAAGGTAAGLYVVVHGAVELVLADAAGNEKVVDFVKTGGLFGEETLFTGTPRSYAVRALTETDLLRLPEAAVEEWVMRFPDFSHYLLAFINERIQYFYRDVFTQSTKNATGRLVCYLLCHFDHAPRTADGTYFLKVPVPKKKLAARLGITPAHLSRAFRELMERGLIVPEPGGFYIPDVPRLSAYVCPAGCDW